MSQLEQGPRPEIDGHDLKQAIDNLFDDRFPASVRCLRLTTSSEGRPPLRESLKIAYGATDPMEQTCIDNVPRKDLSREITLNEDGAYSQEYYIDRFRLDFAEDGTVKEIFAGLVPTMENDVSVFKSEGHELSTEEVVEYYYDLTTMPNARSFDAVEAKINSQTRTGIGRLLLDRIR